MKFRIAALSLAVVLLAGIAVTYVWFARQAQPAAPTATGAVTLTPGPGLLVVINRRLAIVSGDGQAHVSAVECVRVYAAAGTGVCLQPESPWAYHLSVLDSSLATTKTLPIPGLPNRARVSASGRMVAWTTFVGGDSYASGGFSTRTGIIDTKDGTVISTLEDFAITREGKAYQNIDVNFWGVTFAADDDRFYATLGTDGKRYLVEGSVKSRTVRTIVSKVECPSLSPDGTKVAFKQAVNADPQQGWRLSVLDLKTLAVTNTAETRSIDDQAAWLNTGTIAYTVRDSAGDPSVWTVSADGTGQPQLLAPGAESPAALGNHL